MAKLITETFFNELLQHLYEEIDLQATLTDGTKTMAKTITLASAKTFTSAYNKLVTDGYLDE